LNLPGVVHEEVLQALRDLELGLCIDSVTAVAGGCINHGARIDTSAGTSFFLKWNRSAPAGMFDAEADGLLALTAASTLRVPQPLRCARTPDGIGWLLMEYVAPGAHGPEMARSLGNGLAAMHARVPSGGYGWERDNWIGSLAQCNDSSASWGDFWRARRIGPQLELARRSGRARDPVFDSVLDLIPEALGDITAPQLVHGDLWGGNWFASDRGEAVLIDPAVYRGHGEVDLAMSELFGGFGPAFYDGYCEVTPLAEAYAAYRRDLYQLYYLLVHVNLFGAGYEARSLAAARAVVAELR
jgi:fructosamine-3-kinase